MIDRDSPIPLYYQLKMLIKRKIEDGTLSAGDRIPTERVMCRQYHISRAPVRQALAELVQEGYIFRQSGRGTFVKDWQSEPAQRQITLHLLAYDVRWVALMESAVRHWNDLHPERNLQLEVNMPSQAEFHQALCTSMGSEEAPDIVSIDYVWVTRYARLGFLASLDELAPTFAGWLRDELETPVLRNNTLDGQLYGVPVQADVTGLWYRRDWFAAEGLTPPTTWDEWLDHLDHFAKDEVMNRWGHRYPVSFPIGTATGEATLNLLLPFIWARGEHLVDADGMVTVDNPAVIQALEFLHEIVQQKRYLPRDVASFHWWDSPRLLAKGKVPMILGGTYEWPTIAEESGWSRREMADRLGFVVTPRTAVADAPVASLGGTTWAVMRESKHYDLSLEILRMTMDLETVEAFCRKELQISALHSVNRRLVKQGGDWMQAVVPLLAHAQPRPMLENYVQFSRILQQMFEMVLVDDLPVELAVRQVDRTLRLILSG